MFRHQFVFVERQMLAMLFKRGAQRNDDYRIFAQILFCFEPGEVFQKNCSHCQIETPYTRYSCGFSQDAKMTAADANFALLQQVLYMQLVKRGLFRPVV
jgi:hypothetical protein